MLSLKHKVNDDLPYDLSNVYFFASLHSYSHHHFVCPCDCEMEHEQWNGYTSKKKGANNIRKTKA